VAASCGGTVQMQQRKSDAVQTVVSMSITRIKDALSHDVGQP
jgi:hypothetical protein